MTETQTAPGEAFKLTLRSRAELFKGNDDSVEIRAERTFPARRTALILCDVWNNHTCRSAVARLEAMVPRMDEVVNRLRERGVFIIHAPSDTMSHYEGHPARQRMIETPEVALPEPLPLPNPPLPVDASDGGCDDVPQCPEVRPWPWTAEHPGITIRYEDGISDSGQEIYSALRQRDIDHVLILGVHTNMCILHRSFGIKNLVRWRVNTVLVRDLTDTMYNPRMKPFVSHERGTELVIEHIEQHWCPTVLSDELVR